MREQVVGLPLTLRFPTHGVNARSLPEPTISARGGASCHVFQLLFELLMQVVLEVAFWLTYDLFALVVRALPLQRSLPPRQSFKDRLRCARIRRRNRAIRRWLKKGDRRGAIPNIGLKCPGCSYALAGLVGSTCPECGCTFHVASMIDHTVGEGPRRRARSS